MTKLFLLLTLFFIGFNGMADVGNAYRYKVNITLKDQGKLTGYFFFTTNNHGFDPNESDFKEYIFSCYHFPIVLFENLKTIHVNQNLTVDFAQKGSEIIINKNDVVSIELIEEIETLVGSRLRLLSELEYKAVNQDFVNTENICNESYSENCCYYLLNWQESNDLEELMEKMNKKMEELMLENNFLGVNEYIENLKPDLIKRGILLFLYCSPL